MALVTQASDPTLWAALNSALATNPTAKTVLKGKVHYRVIQMEDNTIAYNSKTSKELFDSRSLTRSKPAAYKKLEDR
jgi:hypothetical protein